MIPRLALPEQKTREVLRVAGYGATSVAEWPRHEICSLMTKNQDHAHGFITRKAKIAFI